ncbi:MAG: ABC transporter permease [Mariprofundaceae bacterium]|nr:ABC transporter permease [Mariprofundaceae bacterium]
MSDVGIYLKLGWRNLWQHPLRTGLTLAALALGIAALTFLSAMNDGWMQQIRTNFALTLIGHIQIHAAGFEQSRKLADRIRDVQPVLDVLNELKGASGLQGVHSFTRRLRVSGLASAAGANAGALIYGVEPVKEQHLSRMASFVQQGRWLSADDDRAIVLGDSLADRLQVALGDKVVLMAALENGDIASEVFRVRGLLHSGVLEIDDLAAVVPLFRAQQWLDVGAGVTDIVLRADNFEAVEPLAAALRGRLSGAGSDDALKTPAFEVLTWNQIDPMAEQWAAFADAYSWIVLAVVILVVLVEVLNTMLMSMHERSREFGLMGALGVRGGQMFIMVVWETVILVFLGSLLGFVVGGWLVWYYGIVGIDLSQFATAFSFMYMSPVIHPMLAAQSLVHILAAATLGALVAGLFPAWKVARMDPAKAMREV